MAWIKACGGGKSEVLEEQIFRYGFERTVQNDGMLVCGATYNNNGYGGSWNVYLKVNGETVQTINDHNGSGSQGYAFNHIKVKKNDVIRAETSVGDISLHGYLAVVG